MSHRQPAVRETQGATTLPARILIVRLGAIGDVVNALVLATALKERVPALRIGWAVHDLALPLVQGHPSVDCVHLWARASGLSGLRRIVRAMRRENYALAIDLQRTAKSALLARLSGSPRVLGFNRSRCKELSWLLTREHIPAGDPHAHMVVQYLEFARYLGLGDPRPRHRVPRADEAEAWADDLVRGLGAPPLLIHVGASKGVNRWLPERFGELALALCEGGRSGVCLTGGPADREMARPALAFVAPAGSDSGLRDLVGRTSLLQLAALLRRARLFIGCDTGPMHLAAALGTPVLALFGPADPRRTGPYGTRHRVLRAPLHRGRRRMEGLDVEPVLLAAHEMLNSPGRIPEDPPSEEPIISHTS